MSRAATSPEVITARLTVPVSSVSSRSLTRPRVLRQMEIDIYAMLELCYASVSTSYLQLSLGLLSSNVIYVGYL